MFELEQQLAFDQTAEEMRKQGGRLTERQLRFQAKTALRRFARHWTGAKQNAVAGQIAKSIYLNFDQSKARKPPRESRGNKRLRDQKIIESVLTAATRPTVASIAASFGLSTSAVQRILVRYRLTQPSWSSRYANKYSVEALSLIRLFEAEFPVDGYRLIESADVTTALGIDQSQLQDAADELNSAMQPLQLLMTKVPGRVPNSQWLIVERGRRKSPDFLRSWAKAPLHLLGQVQAKLDQRTILRIDEPPFPENPVFRDACAVILISLGMQSLRTWAAFIEASTVVGDAEDRRFTKIRDPGALLTAVNGAVRIDKLGELLGSMHNWPTDEIDRQAAAMVFGQATELRDTVPITPLTVFFEWARATFYEERISAGLMPGRSPDALRTLHHYRNIEDPDLLLDRLRSVGTSETALYKSATNAVLSGFEPKLALDEDEYDDWAGLDEGFIYPIEESD